MKILSSVQKRLMQENFIKAGGSVKSVIPRKGGELFRLPFLRQWFQTSRAVVMHLVNGTLQVNYIRRIKMLQLTSFCRLFYYYYSTGRLPRSRQNYSVSVDGSRLSNWWRQKYPNIPAQISSSIRLFKGFAIAVGVCAQKNFVSFSAQVADSLSPRQVIFFF